MMQNIDQRDNEVYLRVIFYNYTKYDVQKGNKINTEENFAL